MSSKREGRRDQLEEGVLQSWKLKAFELVGVASVKECDTWCLAVVPKSKKAIAKGAKKNQNLRM